MDAVGAAIRVDARGPEVMRILPRNNDAVNEEWISDKSRHVADGLRTQRLDQPYLRRDGRLAPATWDEALSAVADRLKSAKPERVGAIAGDLAGAEELFALADLMTRLGSPNLDCRQDGAKLDPAIGRASYVFNAGIAGIDESDAILLVGTNPRIEAAVLNARIRKRWRQGGLKVGLVGARADLTYPYDYLGSGPQTLSEIAEGRHAFAGVLTAAKRPLVIAGQAAASRPDGRAVLGLAARIALAASTGKELGASVFNVLHAAAARVAGLDLGFVPRAGGLDAAGMREAAGTGKLDVLYLLGADEIEIPAGAFVIYQGSHGDCGAHRADVILPAAAYTEKSATYANTEGRVQMTQKAVFPPGAAKEDWTIIRALSARLDKTLPYDDVRALRAAMYKLAPRLARLNDIGSMGVAEDVAAIGRLAAVGGSVDATPFATAVQDFYLTNPIARASAVMAELSAIKHAASARPTAAE
jgi:NADH-quinone oxidoreductase subunit G